MKSIWLLLFVLLSLNAGAQGSDIYGNPQPLPAKKIEAANNGQLNHTDEKGLKQGPWEKFYQNGRPAYQATFKDNKPVGVLTRYYTSGKTKVRIDYGADGEKGMAEIFNETGKVIARGIYRNNQKDSTWVFFYAATGAPSATEQYSMGNKNGKTIIYYPNGRVAEEQTWVNGKKDGLWLQFYETGKIKMESANKDGKMHGAYNYYLENGKQEISGLFQNGLEEGKWTFYKADGTWSHDMEFEKGVLKNRQAFDTKQNDQLLEWEKNKEQLRDPEKLVDDPDALMLLR